MAKNWVSRKKSSFKYLAQWMKKIQTKMIVMTEKAKILKALEETKMYHKESVIRIIWNFILATLKTTKTMKEWFQHFNLREHNF